MQVDTWRPVSLTLDLPQLEQQKGRDACGPRLTVVVFFGSSPAQDIWLDTHTKRMWRGAARRGGRKDSHLAVAVFFFPFSPPPSNGIVLFFLSKTYKTPLLPPSPD